MSDLRDIFTTLEAAEAEAKARYPDDPATAEAPAPDPARGDPAEGNRRPIASRNSRWAQKAALWLAEHDITPNQISQASMVFGLLGFLCLWGASATLGPLQAMALTLAAVTMQARLLCNLLDGMVAVEGGQGAPSGPFWNEAPDRVADLLFLWGAGLVAGSAALGLAVAGLAVGTAYLRELGRAEGFPPDFSGPMAKPHRMAALTVGALVAAFLPLTVTAATVMQLTLWVILLGLLVTLGRRSWHLLAALESRAR